MIDLQRRFAAILALALGVSLQAPGPATGAQGPQLFATSDLCMACHNGLTAPSGADVSIGSDWRASMMANAARDPYWQAAVRRETLDHPASGADIENECSICHMPLARYEAGAAGGRFGIFASLETAAAAAVDGVSCTACHQIENRNLGDRASFTGRFVVAPAAAAGRKAYGPYEVDAGRRRVMQSASGFVPEQSAHIAESELCATCHTLYTHTRNARGEVIGELPEQVPYLEWKHSDYYGKQGCPSCHLPAVEGEMAIASVLGQPRQRLARHVFRGGNFFIPRVLNRYRDQTGAAALPKELDAVSRLTVERLETDAARIAIRDVRISRGILQATVTVDNLAGHKLPTAYPSRRAWIRFAVSDAHGKTVFESGALSPDGSVRGNDNDLDPARYEPHYEEIGEAGEVQIYEAILEDGEGNVTTGLLAGLRYAKDNRLLPRGFDKAGADRDIAVRGKAEGDADFAAPGDRVRYRVDLGGAEGPYVVRAELWYQPIGYRWAQNLAQAGAVETGTFTAFYDSMAGSSAVVLARGLADAP